MRLHRRGLRGDGAGRQIHRLFFTAALACDRAFASMANPSGRAVRGVHERTLA
jgi:hypothetical protein